jgi:hypothetical protein
VSARDLLARFGTCVPQPASDWQGDVPLPAAVAAFYAEVGPAGVEVPAPGNWFSFPTLVGLWELQSGYRWHGLTGERLPEWPDGWLVVAAQGGDPLVLDTTDGTLALLGHGRGGWDFGHELPGTLAEVAGAIALLGGLIEDDVDERRYDDDLDLTDGWLAEARRTLVAAYGETGSAVLDALAG